MEGSAGTPKMVAEEQQWYVQKGARVQGPFTTTEVGRYLLLGRVRNTDRVSKDGELWEPVTQVPELIPEELLDLDSEKGWEAYLESHSQYDERLQETPVAPVEERRELDVEKAASVIRDDWSSESPPLRLESKPEQNSRSVSLLPLSLLGLTLSALLFVIYLNSNSTLL